MTFQKLGYIQLKPTDYDNFSSELIDEINYSKFDIYDNQFIVFLSEIWVKISKLYILILRDEEDIDKCYKIYELNEAAEIIKNCLNFKTSLGVVIEKKIN